MRFFSNVPLYFECSHVQRLCVSVLSRAFTDYFAKTLSRFPFNQTCSHRKVTTYTSLYTSLGVGPLAVVYWKSFKFNYLPAICCIEKSNCADRPKHLISLVKFCLEDLTFYSKVQVLGGQYKKLFIPLKISSPPVCLHHNVNPTPVSVECHKVVSILCGKS